MTATDDRPVVVRGRAAGWLARPLATYQLLLGATLLLTALGLVMVFSASSVESYADSGSAWGVGARQLVFATFGIPAMLVVSRLPVRFFRAVAYPTLIVAFVLLVLVLVPGFGVEVNGSRNWLRFGPVQLQPSEFAKFALVVWGADLLARKDRLLDDSKHLLIPLLPVAGVMLAMILAGGDLGTSLVLMAIVAALLFFAGARWSLLLTLAAAALGAIALLSLTTGYRMARITSWLDPESDPLGAGWQALHGTYALASGGIWGLGLGASREKWGALPEAHTDFILAVVGEELGLVGTLMVLVLFAVIAYAGVRIAVTTADPFVRLAAAATTTWIVVQAVVNIGAVLGALPITGIPLPLVSYGGTSLVSTLGALGMLMAFARREPSAAAAIAQRRARRTSATPAAPR
jgi:cell division protein FtsW